MRDRLDRALEELARVDAPADFARRVRARLDAGTAPLPFWPRLAAVAGTLLVVVGVWLAVSAERERSDRAVAVVVDGGRIGRAKALPAQAGAPLAQVTPPTAELGAPIHSGVRAGGPSARTSAGRALALPITALPITITTAAADHEQALPALAEFGAIGPDSLVNGPVTIDAREVAALTAIAPIDIPALAADEGERR